VPELPDITVYIEALEQRILGQTLEGIRLGSPFLLRTIKPTPAEFTGLAVQRFRRIGKRIAIGFAGERWIVLHLMIAGRLHWVKRNAKLPGKRGLAAFDFPDGTLLLTEAGSRKRASLHLIAGDQALEELDPGGLDVFDAPLDAFAERLQSSNHTLKRSLTDPRLFSGIGNAYSDEILHRAQLSPITMTQKLQPEEIERLLAAIRSTLVDWTERLRQESAGAFPEKVTAFRPAMAVHGRYGEPCPRCGEKVQRIRHADNETNYCPKCQTNGKLLADRALSRLLRKDWPKTLEEMEDRLDRERRPTPQLSESPQSRR
jgi:formamidopyrimidine-DNA glycosylase